MGKIVMAKHKKSSVIVLYQDMMKSDVWIGLSGTAKAVYLLFRCKCRWENYQGRKGRGRTPDLLNNNELVFTYEEARKKYGISNPRFKRAIDELILKGFVDIAATGQGTHKATTLYGISERWRCYGTDSFVKARRPKRSRGYPGFKPGNKLHERRRKKILTDTNVHGPMYTNVHGEYLTMYTNVHGEKITKFYKRSGDNWLCLKIA
jgi:hypothetical protein